MDRQYKLIFEDDFQKPLNKSKWKTDTAFYPGSATELRHDGPTHVIVKNGTFSTRENLMIEPVQVFTENGKMIIRCQKTDDGYQSGRVRTVCSPVSKGKFEVRFKAPCGVAGLLPRIRVTAAAKEPYTTAYDLVSLPGEKRTSVAGMHVFWHDTLKDANRHVSYLGSTRASAELNDGFHTFTLELTGTDVFFYADGVRFFAADLTHAGFAAFHQSYVLELELTANSNEIPAPKTPVPDSSDLVIEYVRIYELEE